MIGILAAHWSFRMKQTRICIVDNYKEFNLSVILMEMEPHSVDKESQSLDCSAQLFIVYHLL